MRWRDWMEAALYDPDSGYYTTAIREVGRRGDFATSATLTNGLARAVAAWIRAEWRRHAARLPIIEIGPGNGALHAAVLRALGPLARLGLRTYLVERSPVLRGLQQATLRSRRRSSWHPDMTSALAACGGRALVFSNEVADAFPATLMERADGAWLEVWLRLEPDGRIVECLEPRCPPPDGSAIALTFPDGHRVEVLESWRDWLASWVPAWSAGTMLTIDYGGSAREIHERRPAGTARGYRHHQVIPAAELYAATGRSDITVDVNFDDLARWGEAVGLVTETCITQAEFVRPVVPDDQLCRDPGGAGDAFRCLVQRRVRPS